MTATVHSPCIGVCRLDEETGYCLGCGRTGSEVAEWASADDQRKALIWRSLPARLGALGTKIRLMPWSPAAVGDWVVQRLVEGAGNWVVGAAEASAAFADGKGVTLNRIPTQITAHRKHAAFRLELHDKLRAFAFGADPIRSMVVLALPRARLSLPVATAFAPLGSDVRAIDPKHRGLPLFDIGLGRKECRVCLRTADPRLAGKLDMASGHEWMAASETLGLQLLDTAHVVVETALARLEVYAPLLCPDELPSVFGTRSLLQQTSKAIADASDEIMLPGWAVPVAAYNPQYSFGNPERVRVDEVG